MSNITFTDLKIENYIIYEQKMFEEQGVLKVLYLVQK